MTTLSEEEENYVRMSLLLAGVSQRAVRCRFDKEFPPAALPATIKKEFIKLGDLKGKRFINQTHWNVLHPINGFPDSKNFDVTLMICLLRNLTTITPPSLGFDCLPPPGEITDGADLARIKYYTNYLAHLDNTKIDNSYFTSAWTDVADAVGRLGGHSMVQEYQELKVKILDQSNKEIMDEIKQSQEEIKEIKQSFNSPKTDHEEKFREIEKLVKSYVNLKTDHDEKIKEIDNLKATQDDQVPWNIRGQINRKLEVWKKDDKMFMETRAATRVLECVKTKSCVTVTGSSGMGKTFTVRHVALQMAVDGYDILPVTNPDDIDKFYNPNKKAIFVIDNFCGTYTLNQNILDKWKSLSDTITDILEDKVTKIIVSCRTQIYQDDLFQTLPLFTSCECNLMSKDLCLLPKERQSLAELYLKTDASTISQYANLYDCFPLLCKLYRENPNFDVTDFFKNPFSVYETEVSKLWTEKAYGKYCALALCVMFNNHLKEEWLTEDIDKDMRTVIENTCEACKLERGTSRLVIRDELESLINTFIRKKDNFYCTIHDKLFDYLVNYFGKVMIPTLIKNGDSRFIVERFLFELQDDSDQFTIIVPDKYQQMYLQRMIDDWSTGNATHVFNNINMKIQKFRDIFMNYLNKMEPLFQNKLAKICDMSYNTTDMSYQRPPWGKYISTTPLIKCCLVGDINMVQWFCDHGSDVHHYNGDMESPLYMACMKGHIGIVTTLLDNKANVNLCTMTRGETPLYKACAGGYTEVVTKLLDNKANVNQCTNEGESPLYTACAGGYTEVVTKLLDNKANVYQCTMRGESPLYKACAGGYTEVVTKLLDNKANVNQCTMMRGETPLYKACAGGYTEVVTKLLDNKANVNQCTDEGETPLYKACAGGYTEVVTKLLDNKANVNQCTNEGETPLYKACSGEYTEVVTKLLDNKANVNQCTNEGESPLYKACAGGYTEVVTILLDNKANVNLCTNEGESPLYKACAGGYTEVVTKLLDNKADVNKCTMRGESPLYKACVGGYTEMHYYGHTGIVDMLLKVLDLTSSLKEKYLLANIDRDEFHSLLLKGSYKSYQNRIYLSGPCNVGKTTLASVLTGDDIPMEWDSTNGLQIYFGQNGIDLKEKKMISITEGERGRIVQRQLLTAIREKDEKSKTDGDVAKGSKDDKPDEQILEDERGNDGYRQELTTIRENDEKRNKDDDDDDDMKENAVHPIGANETQSTEGTLPYSAEENTAYIDHQAASAKVKQIIPPPRPSEESNHHVKEEISQPSSDPGMSKRSIPLHEKIHKNMLDDIRKDEYSLDVAPSDLIDFGGHRAFDMIHQLFLSQHGTVLLMFNGKYDLSDVLPEYSEKVTTAEILIHWVNSVLTYCTEQPDGMPVIQFVATHADLFEEGSQREKRKLELARQLEVIFGSHEKKAHLHYDPLFFINASDKYDEEIEKLKDKLVEVAYTQMHWGRDMPLAWVPLEKQISDLRHQGKNILHMEDLLKLNEKNEEFSMDKEQLSYFLKWQHAHGKMLFFDQEDLRNCVIIEPVFLVNVLKSFITDDMFIPKDQLEIAKILASLQKHGFIAEQDLFKVWEQPEYKYLLQYKEYIVKILEMLGVIVTPKTFYTQKVVSFIVPSMVRATCDSDYISKNITFYKSICMRYVVRTAISRILFFRLTAAAIGIWPLQKHGERQMLFHGFATFDLDEDNEFSLCLKNDEIDVYFTHKKSVESIQPDYVASVQECLTSALKSIVEFYQTSFSGKKSENQIFQIQYGVLCTEGPCFCKSENQQEIATWDCRHDHVHDVKYLWYWEADKLKKKRIQSVSTADFPPEILNTQPPLELFQNIALAVGRTGADLGLKLGLSNAVVEKMMFGKTYNIFQKTEKILDRWQLMSVDDTTIYKIIMTLLDIGGRGIEAITKFYQLKYSCKWIYGSVVENLPRRARSKSLPDVYLSHRKSTDKEWFFKLKLFCDDKYDVHVINSHRIEGGCPSLEKYVKKKENVLHPDTLQMHDTLQGFEKLYLAVKGKPFCWRTELINAISMKQSNMCRWIVASKINGVDLVDAIDCAIKGNDVESAKALSWGITRKFYDRYRNHLQEAIDIYPGVRCKDPCKHLFCSEEKVILVITQQDVTKFLPESYSGFEVEVHNLRYMGTTENEGATLTYTLSQKYKESFCLDVGFNAGIAKDLFSKHSNLTSIFPSVLKSCSFNTALHEIKDEICIQLHCKRKGIIPFGENHLPASIQGVPTDVIEGNVELITKLHIGEKIGSRTVYSGTLAGFVRYMKLDCFLTCAHVMFDQETLIKPDFKDLTGADAFIYISGGQPFQCGNVIRKVFDNGDQNRTSIDAALVLMQNYSSIDPNDCTLAGQTLSGLGLRSTYLNENCLDYADFKDKLTGISCHGAKTGRFECDVKLPQLLDVDINLTSATTTAVNVNGQLCYPLFQSSPAHIQLRNSHSPRPVMMFNQIEMQIPLKPGDSGTAIYITNHPRNKNGCIGMVIACNTQTGSSFVTPLTEILKRFNS